MKSKFLFLTILTAFIAGATPPVEEGKTIFTTRCAGCHNIKKQLLGPALAGVNERRSLDWIVSFVHSSQTMIQNGDKDAVALFKQFNNIPMPDHKDLSDEKIKSVVEYIKSEANSSVKKEPVKKEKPSFDYKILTGSNNEYLFVYAGLFALLIATLLFAYQVKQYKRKVFSSK